jgi:hypothetical protein
LYNVLPDLVAGYCVIVNRICRHRFSYLDRAIYRKTLLFARHFLSSVHHCHYDWLCTTDTSRKPRRRFTVNRCASLLFIR